MNEDRSRRPEGGSALVAGLVGMVPVLLLVAFVAVALRANARTLLPAHGNPVSARVAATPAMPAGYDAVVVGGDACAAGSRGAGGSTSYGTIVTDDEGLSFAWALVKPSGDDGRETFGSTDERASRLIKRELRQQRSPFLYARVDGRDWVVRDPALVERAGTLVQPMQDLGRKMGELGGRQGALGSRQGRIGGQQGTMGAKQARIAARRAELAARAAVADEGGDRDELRRLERELDAQQDAIGRQMGELGRQQAELGEQQAALGREQGRYGQQMNKVSRDVGDAIQSLVREAARDGKAKAVGVSETSL